MQAKQVGVFCSSTKSSLSDTFVSTQEPAKQIWLITYASGCQSLNHELLSTFGINVDECYTITWRESKYSLIHLSKQNRIRRTAITKAMHYMKDTNGIIWTEIFGFDSASCNSKANDESLEQHPGFKRMLKTLNDEPEKLESWMVSGTLEDNKKGLLWKYMESTHPEQMTRAQLIKRVKEWGPLVREHEDLNERNTLLAERLQLTEAKLHEMPSAYNKERKCNDELMMQLVQAIRKPGS